MKKFISIFLALIYLSTSSGLALQVHYCMDKVTGMSLVEHEKKACDKCGMEKGSNTCCKDELAFIKLKDAHKLLVADYQLQAPVAIIGHGFQTGFVPAECITMQDYPVHSPPAAARTSLHILHCVFRI
jgi:hypothetical protein